MYIRIDTINKQYALNIHEINICNTTKKLGNA